MAALHLVFLVNHHVVAQIVKTEFVVCPVSNIGVIRFFALVVFKVMYNQADAQAEKTVNLAHPFGVAAGKVVVDGNNVHAFAGKRV